MPTAESPGVSMFRGKKEYPRFCGRERGKRKTEALAWVLVELLACARSEPSHRSSKASKETAS